MLSVTSNITPGAPYPSAPPKPALPDPSQMASDFASLVDNSLPVDPSSQLPPAPEPVAPQPQRSAADAPPPADSNPSPPQAGNQNPAPRSADDSDSANSNQQAAPPNANGNTPPRSSSGSKSGASKSDRGKLADKISNDDSQGTDATASAQPAAAPQTSTTQNLIAAFTPSATSLNNAAATSGNASAPLAIAAAAIAATSSATSALTGSSPQMKTDDTGQAAIPQTTAVGTGTTTKTALQIAAIGTAAQQHVPATDLGTAANEALTAAGTEDAATAGTITGFKTGQVAQTKTTANSTGGKTQGTSDPSVAPNAVGPNGDNNTPQPTLDAKPDAGTGTTGDDTAKPDVDNASATSATTAPTHDHSAIAGNGQAPNGPADPTLATVPQQSSSVAATTPTDKFTVTQATGGAVPLSGLAVQIAASVQSGKTHFDVRLDPADLGRIDVRIAVDQNGQVTSHLTVEKPETLSLLQQDAPQLQQALNDAGLKTGDGGLQFSLRDQSSSSGQNDGNQNGAQPQRLVINEDDTVPAAVAGRSYGRMLGASGGIDIRV